MIGLQPRNHELGKRLRAAYRQACLSELDALKPGNVHRFSEGHGMTLEDFITSADVSAKPLTEPGVGLGERIFRAVEATREAVGCNTNLGILMLCAPLIQALFDEPQSPGSLREGVCKVLTRADAKDVDRLFCAIQLAAPGGLGRSDRHDVFEPPTARLIEVMTHAAERDLIARQYAFGYANLFEFALPWLRTCEQRWQSRKWAITGLFLSLLARFPDSHIERKYGHNKAVEVSQQASRLAKELFRAEKPERCHLRLLKADSEFKREGINPGTSADLTVATLFISHLESMLPALVQKTGCTRVRDSHPDELGIRN